MSTLLLIVAAYLLGSILFAIVTSRLFGLEDPRYGYSEGKFASVSHLYSPHHQYLLGSENTNRFFPPAGLHVELLRTFTAPNYMTLYFYKIVR